MGAALRQRAVLPTPSGRGVRRSGELHALKGLDLFSATLRAIGLAEARPREIAQSKSAKLFGFAWIYLALFGFAWIYLVLFV
jgi:hypothetical protein